MLYLLFLFTAALPVGAAVLQESFATDPFSHGWRTFGDASLFRWDPANHNLEATWDSSRSNSFFALPLGTILSKADDFSFSFDVRLSDIHSGTTPGKSNEFQIAIGLIDRASAIRPNAFRGAGTSSLYGVRNVVEFNYFKFDHVPLLGYGDTFASVVISTNNQIWPVHNELTMTTGDNFRITLEYTATNQLLRTKALRNGKPYGMAPDNTLADLSLTSAKDFRVDTFAIISYSDAIQASAPKYHGSILAHGTVDNIQLNLSAPPIANLALEVTNSLRRALFLSQTGWTYWLERSANLTDWSQSAGPMSGNGFTLSLSDNATGPGSLFYRVRAERP